MDLDRAFSAVFTGYFYLKQRLDHHEPNGNNHYLCARLQYVIGAGWNA